MDIAIRKRHHNSEIKKADTLTDRLNEREINENKKADKQKDDSNKKTKKLRQQIEQMQKLDEKIEDEDKKKGRNKEFSTDPVDEDTITFEELEALAKTEIKVSFSNFELFTEMC